MNSPRFFSSDQFIFWNAHRFRKQPKSRAELDNFIDLLILVNCTEERGLTVSESELQRAADCFRHSQDLHSSSQTHAYFKENGLEVSDFELLLEFQLLYNKLKQSLSSVDAVQEVFTQNLHLFETVELAGLSFESKDMAENFLKELPGEKSPISNPLFNQSVSPETDKSWISMGNNTRSDLPEEAASRIFSEDAPNFVGPFETNGKYWIYRILRPKQAEVNEDVYAVCEELIIQNFLKKKKKEMFGNSLDQFLKGGT